MSYRSAILTWASQHNVSVTRGRYARAVASGETSFWRLKPANPIAQVFLVHGTGDDAFFPFAGLIQSLLTARVQIFLFDLDGHGRDSTTILGENSIQSCLQSAWQFGFEPSLPNHIVGFSLGASLIVHGMRINALQPSSVLLLALPIKLDPQLKNLWQEALTVFRPSFWQVDRQIPVLDRLPAIGMFGRKKFPIRLPSQNSSSHYVDRVSAIVRRLGVQRFFQSSTPTAILYAENDEIVAQETEKSWPRLTTEIMQKTIPDCSHFFLPSHPESIEIVTKWIQEQS